jgi:hypothetical protein
LYFLAAIYDLYRYVDLLFNYFLGLFMRHIKDILYIMVLILCISCTNHKIASANGVNPSSSDLKSQNNDSAKILVRFKPGTKTATIKTIQEKLGLVTVRTLNVPDLYLMKITNKASIEVIIKKLNKYDEVLYAEPDHKYRINAK